LADQIKSDEGDGCVEGTGEGRDCTVIDVETGVKMITGKK
jgi:hypothetical protein